MTDMKSDCATQHSIQLMYKNPENGVARLVSNEMIYIMYECVVNEGHRAGGPL